MNYRMHKANILEWAAAYSGPKYHALLCDPPYHMTEMTKRFANSPRNEATVGGAGPYLRHGRGFMGTRWDGGTVAFEPETWFALAEHLYPGAFGMAFASSRGWHRMAVAIEDAGLIIHPSMFGWSYGSGFPKATRPDVQIDRKRGQARKVVGTRKHAPKFDAAGHGYREKDNGFNSRERETFDVTEPASDESAAWSGHRYGLQCIKPALEPIIVFQKPYSRQGAVADMLAYGSGAIWIDGGRIGTGGQLRWEQPRDMGYHGGTDNGSVAKIESDVGRWPSNLLLIHTPRCDADGCADDCPVVRLGAQSGETTSKASMRGAVNTGTFGGVAGEVYNRRNWKDDYEERGHEDSGTAARYFAQMDYTLDRLEQSDPVFYCAKASRAEREAGLDPRTVAFMRSLDDSEDDLPVFDEVTVDDGRKKSIDNAYLRGETKRRNPHPTVKPLSLCRYLATLLLPPATVSPRRLLVPFAGVGSELIGGLLAGWDEIDGIELDEDGTHIPVANARIAYWLARRAELSDPSKPITVKAAPTVAAGQVDMFAESEVV